MTHSLTHSLACCTHADSLASSHSLAAGGEEHLTLLLISLRQLTAQLSVRASDICCSHHLFDTCQQQVGLILLQERWPPNRLDVEPIDDFPNLLLISTL